MARIGDLTLQLNSELTRACATLRIHYVGYH